MQYDSIKSGELEAMGIYTLNHSKNQALKILLNFSRFRLNLIFNIEQILVIFHQIAKIFIAEIIIL